MRQAAPRVVNFFLTIRVSTERRFLIFPRMLAKIELINIHSYNIFKEISMDSNFIIKERKSKKLNKLCTGHRIETERTFEYSSSVCQDTCPFDSIP